MTAIGRAELDLDADMSDPKTLAEQLDAARNGEEFGQVIQGLFRTVERQMDDDGGDAA